MNPPADFDPPLRDDGMDRPVRRQRHQPADPIELSRFPPRDDVCRGFRDLLRDYCDGETSAAETAAVDDHVHLCRDCALALSRAEGEQLTLRRALGAIREDADRDGAAGGVFGPSFTRRVMAEISAILLEEAEAPPQFTRGVMERVRHEWRQVPLWRRLVLRVRSRGWGVAVVAAVLLFAAVGAIGFWPKAERSSRPELSVVRTAAASLVVGSTTRPVREGTTLAVGAMVRVEDQGEVVLAQSLPASPVEAAGEPVRIEPGATLHLFGGTNVRVRDDATLDLLAGALRCTTGEHPHALGLVDGSSLELEAGGDYEISLMRVRRFDRAIAEFSSRLRLEVRNGRAEFRRADLESVRVERGQVAHAEGIEVALEDLPLADGIAIGSVDSGSPIARTEASPGGVLLASGRVVDAASGRGVAAARVSVHSVSGRSTATVSDAEGWFRFEVETDALEHVTVAVTPPSQAESDLGVFGPRPVEIARDARGVPLLTVALSADLATRGRVLDAEGSPIAGARVTAWVVDEAFSLLRPLDVPAAASAADGSFALRGLPADLDGRESLAVLVESSGRPRVAHPTWRGGEDLVLRVPSPRRLLVAGLPAGAALRVVQEIPGVPLLAMAESYELVASEAGEAELAQAGPGALWLDQREQGGGLIALSASADGKIVASATTASMRVFGPHRKWIASASDGRAALLRPSHRHRFEHSAASVGLDGPERAISVVASASALANGARVFLETSAGELAFVGLWDGLSELRYRVPAVGFRLVVIGVDGSFGVLDAADGEVVASSVELLAPGSAVASADFAAVRGACVFELLDGPLAGQRFWREVDFGVGIGAERLPPGSYRVTMPDGRLATCQIASSMTAQLVPIARPIEER
ncbi:MAG: zf-HC2 domain-containing protein [Planctomycetota bacterium]